MGATFLKSDIYDTFEPVLACYYSQIIILHANYVMQVYLTLISFYITRCDF